jgi:hypothetical protein
MNPRITHVTVVGAQAGELRFTDGSPGVVDLAPRLAGRGGLFEALQGLAFFARVRVDEDEETIARPNGVAFEPDVLDAAIHAASDTRGSRDAGIQTLTVLAAGEHRSVGSGGYASGFIDSTALEVDR